MEQGVSGCFRAQVLGEVSQGCDKRQHMGTKSAGSPPSPASAPQPPQRPGGTAAKAGGGEGGKGDFIALEYICLADISWILLGLLRAAL